MRRSQDGRGRGGVDRRGSFGRVKVGCVRVRTKSMECVKSGHEASQIQIGIDNGALGPATRAATPRQKNGRRPNNAASVTRVWR
jgi:hypothetical protein